MTFVKIQKQLVRALASIGILTMTLLHVLVALCLLPLRAVVNILDAIYRPDLENLTSGLTSTFSCFPRFNIVYYMYVNGHLSLEDNRSHLKKIFLNDANRNEYKRLRMTWTTFCGYIFWKEDPDFKIENHFREYDYTGKLELPKNVMREDATRVMGGLTEAPWKEGRSPWESFLIPLAGNSEETLWIFRHHHAIMDGFGAIGFLKAVTQTDYKFCPTKHTSRKHKSLLDSTLRLPSDFVDIHLQKRYVQNNWDLPALEGPRDYVTTSVRAITVEKAKAAKNKLGTAYAPTVLSILGGGLERLFEEACLPVPKHLITGAPFPLPDHPGGLVNHVIPTYFPWRIQARSAVERAQDIESEMNKLSNPVITTVQSALIEITGTLPTFLLKPIASSLNSRCSVGASIFPVFDAIKKLTLNQIQYMEACVGSPGKSIGTTVVACGINGDQRIVFIMDRRVFPDEKLFQLFGKYVEEELESILSNAQNNLSDVRNSNARE